jgi:hypothetical protein
LPASSSRDTGAISTGVAAFQFDRDREEAAAISRSRIRLVSGLNARGGWRLFMVEGERRRQRSMHTP